MKKLFILIGIVFLLSGCGKYDDKDLIKDLTKKVENSKAYYMTGTLEIFRNEERYTYDVKSSYKHKNYFKVDLTNQTNNHQQIILKNDEGVYVLTPSLNKNFKFQSEWPYNNSQIYLLQPILDDINNDKERTFEKTTDGYVITSKVNYSSERDFSKQKIYVDKNKNITKIEVLDKSDNIKMNLTIIDIDYKATFDDNYFNVEKYMTKIDDKQNQDKQKNEKQESTNDETTKEENNEEITSNETSEESSKLSEIVYPMYVPTETYLTSQDVIETSVGERAILTFSGESSFTVVQENLEKDISTNYVYGDPYLILDTVGLVTDSSVSWISNGTQYSVMSDTMNIDELLTVAQSIRVEAVGK